MSRVSRFILVLSVVLGIASVLPATPFQEKDGNGSPPAPVETEAIIALIQAQPEPIIARAYLRWLFFYEGPRKAASFLEAVQGLEGREDLAAALEPDMKMANELEAFLSRLFSSMAKGGASYRLLDGREKFTIQSYEGAKLTLLDRKGNERVIGPAQIPVFEPICTDTRHWFSRAIWRKFGRHPFPH